VIWLAVLLIVLVLAVVLGLQVRELWRKGKVLAAEFATASARIDQAMTPLQNETEELEQLRAELAVFSNPELLRHEQAKAAKKRGRAASGRR